MSTQAVHFWLKEQRIVDAAAKLWFKSTPSLSAVGAVTCLVLLFNTLQRTYLQLRGRGLVASIKQGYTSLVRETFGWLLESAFLRKKVDKEVAQSIDKIAAKLNPPDSQMVHYTTLPNVGWAPDSVVKELENMSHMDHARWEDGKVSGAVYHGGNDMTSLQTTAYNMFAISNPIHPDVFPGVRKMEAEVISMVLSLFNAPPGAAGTSTSGGTESIFASCLSARERGRTEKGIKRPEMILPSTAHPAFHKVGKYFGIKIHEVECPAPNYQVDTKTVSRLINRNTVLIVGSAPNFPHGVIDDITELSRLALQKNIHLHVDCCLGSFLVPFLDEAGFETAPFDFRLPGVSSISCDTHKYGFAPKGNSVALFRTKLLRSYQYFISPDWSGGVYASQGLLGSRAGALIAGCWASMMTQGSQGYLEACRQIVGSAKRIESALRSEPLSRDLQVIGKPLVSVVAFTSKTLNIWNLADGMSELGWHLNAMQSPPAIHIAVTLPIVKSEDILIRDLIAVVLQETQKLAEGGEKGTPGDSFALYGVAGSLPNKGVVVKLASGYLDTLYNAE